MRIKNFGACYPSIDAKVFVVRLNYNNLVLKYKWDKCTTHYNDETAFSIQIGCPVEYIKRK